MTIINAPLTTAPAPLLRRDEGAIAILTLARPQTRNALCEEMLGELANAFDAIAADAKVRVIILQAEGPVFSSGHDLREMTAHRADSDAGRAYFTWLMKTCSSLMMRINSLPQPVIAAVEGVATAAGCQLVASCDLAIAGAGAKFCTPGVNLGLFCSTPMVALSRSLQRKHALEMLLGGEMTDAAEALRLGLVNRVVAEGEALAGALALARKIASKSASTVKTGKQAFYAQLEMNVSDAYDHASRVMVENMLAQSAREGIDAFLTKRAPDWRGE